MIDLDEIDLSAHHDHESKRPSAKRIRQAKKMIPLSRATWERMPHWKRQLRVIEAAKKRKNRRLCTACEG
jgi:hypothetical protein